MGHGASWFAFLPGYEALQHFVAQGPAGLLFGTAPVVQHVFAAVLVILVILAVALRARAQLTGNTLIPPPEVSIRNVLEVVLEGLYKQSKQIIGKDAARYFPVIGTLALFIFFSNVLGLIPGFVPPTDNWNTTMACGGFVFLYYNWHGLRANGLGHLAHMANPAGTSWGWWLAPLMFPIELVSHIARPVTLGIRLSANMIGDHAVLAAFLGLVPILVPLPFLVLGLMVCLIQTLVFVLLTMVYLGLAVAEQHHDDAHDGAQAPAR
jgi:F-type H+-transporting ATPase subunit a